MKKVTLLAALAVLILAVACAPTGGQEPIAAEPTNEAQGDMKTLYVGPEQVECTGVVPMMCLQVKEDPAGEYQLFYNAIEGFTFEPGYTYELLVRVETVANPPADGSSLRYILVEEVSRTAVSDAAPSGLVEDNALQGVRWLLASYLNAGGQTVAALPDREVTAEFGPDGQLGGNAGCNSYFASYTVDGSNLTIGQAGSTMMACEPAEIMEQEAQFLAALTSAATWQVEGETLTLRNAAGDAAVTFQAAAPQTITGTTWSAVNLNTGNAVSSLLPDTTITATFGEDGQVTGNAGCNNFFAGYTVEGDTLTIDQAGSTMMACEPAEVMAQETHFLAALANSVTWSIERGQLRLLNADGHIMAVFNPVEAASLTGTAWGATAINNGNEAVSSVVADTIVTATFAEDGKLNGSAGCNNFMTSYTLDGESITIQPAATTRKMCPGEGIMAQETNFLNALTSVATWRIDGDTLELRTADGALALSFVAQPAP